MMNGNVLHATVQMGVIRFKVLIFISPSFLWNMLTTPESTLLLKICIDSLPVFWMSIILSRIQMYPLMKGSVSFHYSIIWNGLKNLTRMILSIEIMEKIVLHAWMEYRKKNHPEKIWNKILDVVVKILKYKKSTIDDTI